MSTPKDWVNFAEAKAVSFEVVLKRFKLLEKLTREGEELKGFCPFHPGSGKKDSFSVNVGKGVFHCFACKRKGSALDFVSLHERISVKDAARLILDLARLEEDLKPVEEERRKAAAENEAWVTAYRREEGRATPAERRHEFKEREERERKMMWELCDSIVSGELGRSLPVMSWREARKVVGSTVGAHEVVVIHLREFMAQLLGRAGESVTLPNEEEQVK